MGQQLLLLLSVLSSLCRINVFTHFEKEIAKFVISRYTTELIQRRVECIIQRIWVSVSNDLTTIIYIEMNYLLLGATLD